MDGTGASDVATFLAIRGHEPIGIVAARRDKRAVGLFRVASMWVAPEARRLGLGLQLLEAVEAWIRTRDGTAARLSVTEAAPGARRLYERAGYKPDGRHGELVHTPGLFFVGLQKTLAYAAVPAAPTRAPTRRSKSR